MTDLYELIVGTKTVEQVEHFHCPECGYPCNLGEEGWCSYGCNLEGTARTRDNVVILRYEVTRELLSKKHPGGAA